LPRKIAQFIKLILDFLNLRFENGDPCLGCDTGIWLVHRHVRLSDPVGRQSEGGSLLLKCGHALVEFCVKIRGLFSVPLGIF
jgi:hypothetical protein